MEQFHKRYAEVRAADDMRDALLADLMQKVNDLQKTMDRNAFILVLVNGNCMNFLHNLVIQGISGGEEAAKRLRRAVFNYLRYDEDFKHDHKIVIRVYANLQGLTNTYADKGMLPNVAAFSDFILGFNKAHPLCDFIDAGNQKEAADIKLKEILSLYIYNVHCKQIIFGTSADNGYASFLSSFSIDTDVSTRIRLLKGPPFSKEFQQILGKFKSTEFKDVFRSEQISDEQTSRQYNARSSDESEISHGRCPFISTANGSNGLTWRPKRVAEPYITHSLLDDFDLPTHSVEPSAPTALDPDHDSSSSDAIVEVQEPDERSSYSSKTSSKQHEAWRKTANPSAYEIATALVEETNALLLENPQALDFGKVKTTVEQRLGLTPDFWPKKNPNAWFQRSKNIMKRAIEDWIISTDNPPPKNATWLPRHFPPGESPSAFLKQFLLESWRTKLDPVLKFQHADVATHNQTSVPQSLYSYPDKDVDENEGTDIEETATLPQKAVIIEHVPQPRNIRPEIPRNVLGQRIDLPTDMNISPSLLHELRNRSPRLCNAYYLADDCANPSCPYDHNLELNPREFEALLYLSQTNRCSDGSACNNGKCTKGHICPSGRYCRHGRLCRFSDLHDIDKKVVNQ